MKHPDEARVCARIDIALDDHIIFNMTLSMTNTVSIADRVVSAVIFILISEIYLCYVRVPCTTITSTRDMNPFILLACTRPVGTDPDVNLDGRVIDEA